MGDTRFTPFYERVRDAPNAAAAIRALSDEGVIAALAAASREHNPYLANVLASEALNRARQKETITSTLAEGVYAVNADGGLTFMNPAAARMLGLDARAMLGQPIHDIIHPRGANLSPEPCPLIRALEHGETLHAHDGRFAQEGGKWFPVATSCAPIVREGGIEGAVVAFQDITHRKAAEDELRMSERRLAAAQQLAHVGSWEWDLVSDRVVWSDEMYRIYGLPPGSVPVTWNAYLAGLPVSERDQAKQNLQERLRQGGSFEFEREIERPNGSIRCVHGRVEVVLDAQGLPRRLVGTMQDITERKQAERGLAKALRDLENVLATIPDVIYQIDLDGRLVLWNGRVREVTGYTDDELRGKPAIEFVPPEERAGVMEAIERTMREGSGEFEGHMLCKDGTKAPYHWSGMLFRDGNGEPLGIIGAARDMTERRRWEEDLMRSEERFRLLARATHDTVYDWDLVRDEIWWNDNFWEMFGYEPGSIVPDMRWWVEQVHPEDLARSLESLDEALKGSAAEWVQEYRIRCADGGYLRVLERAHIMREDGRATRMLGSLMSLDERGSPASAAP